MSLFTRCLLPPHVLKAIPSIPKRTREYLNTQEKTALWNSLLKQPKGDIISCAEAAPLSQHNHYECHLFSPYSSLEDEEEVGSRSRWPALPLREEALQGQRLHQVMRIQPQKHGSHVSSRSNSESLSRFSQSTEPSSDHTHHVRRPATSQWAFSPSATRGLRLTSIWTAGLAQCLPGP